MPGNFFRSELLRRILYGSLALIMNVAIVPAAFGQQVQQPRSPLPGRRFKFNPACRSNTSRLPGTH